VAKFKSDPSLFLGWWTLSLAGADDQSKGFGIESGTPRGATLREATPGSTSNPFYPPLPDPTLIGPIVATDASAYHIWGVSHLQPDPYRNFTASLDRHVAMAKESGQ
jgi:hypothetical protein